MEKIVVAFATTSNAMAMEIYANKKNIVGKLIPIPNEMSAGCGLCWLTDTDDEMEVKSILEEGNLSWERMELIVFKE